MHVQILYLHILAEQERFTAEYGAQTRVSTLAAEKLPFEFSPPALQWGDSLRLADFLDCEPSH